MIKKTVYFIILLYLFSLLVFAGAFIEKFSAKSENGNVTIEWKTNQEDNVKNFEIERKSGNSDAFISISTIKPTGSFSFYQYIDKTAYKETDALYIYRLKIIDNDPSNPPTYSNLVSVMHSVSSVKSTWGKIKSMFR